MNLPPSSSDWPMVTVLAPCRNESGFIRDAISSIRDNDYPADRFEILVLDGMSSDGTREIVADICAADRRVHLVDNPRGIVPTGMNLGISLAKGEFIVRIDCHSSFPANYLRKCIEVSLRTGAGNVGGYWTTLPGADTPAAVAISLATSNPFGVGNSAFRLREEGEKETDTVPFGTFPRHIFEAVGQYDERLVRNQDIELNSRIRSGGFKVVISPEISLSYVNRATLKGLWQQSFNNGRWNPYTLWLTGGSLRIRHFIPFFFVAALLVQFLGAFQHPIFLISLSGFLAAYSATAFLAAHRSGTEGGKTSLIRVVASFFVLHLSYGLGTLWGLGTVFIKFPNRKTSAPGKVLADRRS